MARQERSRETWYYVKDSDAAGKLAYEAAKRCVDRDSRRARFRKMRQLCRGGTLEDPSEHNVIGNAVTTVVAKIGKSEVMPVARATGVRRSRQERAKRLSDWVQGWLQVGKVHRLGRRALRDSATYGSGALYPHRGLDGRPTVERVWIGNLGVEEFEEEEGNVRTLYRIMTIDRAVALKTWPSKAAKLEKAGLAFPDENKSRVLQGDPVTVAECWRLTTGHIKGRHVLCTSDGALRDDEWDSQAFPIKFHHWEDDPERFFGVGLVEGMAGEQAMLNAITEKIEESFDQGGPRIVVDTAAKVQTERLDNTPYGIIRYTSTGGGQPPVVVNPPAISSDYRMHQETLIARTQNMHGLSELSTSSRKPVGLNSGVALDTYADIESERFYMQTKDYEQLFVEVGEGLIEVAEAIASDPELSEQGKADVLFTTKGTVRMVRYDDAKLPADQRSLQVEAVSQFSATLSGRIQQADTLRNLGVLHGEDQVLELLDDPNLKKFRSMESSARYVVEVQVERCLAGKRQTPDPTLPLDFALRTATQALHRAILEQGDDDDEQDDELTLGMGTLRDYMADVQTLLEQLEPANRPPPDVMPPGAVPPGAMPPMPAATPNAAAPPPGMPPV